MNPKDLYDFYIFVQIAESGGITSAQHTTGLGQPALSTTLSRLEHKLGFRLCDRGRGGFRLTPQGDTVLRDTKELLTRFDAFGESLGELSGKPIGKVPIGCIDNLMSYPQSPITQTLLYVREYTPSIQFLFHQDDIYQLERRLMAGSDNLLIGVLPEQMQSSMRCEPLFTEVSQLYIANQRRKSDHYPIKVICTGYAPNKSKALIRQQFESIEINDQLTLEAGLMQILAGDVAVFLPTHYADQYVKSGLITSIRPDEYCYDSQISVCFNPKRKLSLATEFVLKTLLRYAQKAIS